MVSSGCGVGGSDSSISQRSSPLGCDHVMLMGILVVFGKFRAFIFMLGLTLKVQALQSFEISGATSL